VLLNRFVLIPVASPSYLHERIPQDIPTQLSSIMQFSQIPPQGFYPHSSNTFPIRENIEKGKSATVVCFALGVGRNIWATRVVSLPKVARILGLYHNICLWHSISWTPGTIGKTGVYCYWYYCKEQPYDETCISFYCYVTLILLKWTERGESNML